MSDRPARRGRPPLADPEVLRERALRVILDHGYDAVPMSRIAAEVGVSVRTLHRYFPAKADIVWGSVDDSFETIRRALATTGPDVPVADAVADAMGAAFTAGDAGLVLARERVRLIASTPELQAIRSETFDRWRAELTAFVARRLGEPVDGLVPVTTATALQSAMMAALAWWAQGHDDAEPREVVMSSVRGLGRLASA